MFNQGGWDNDMPEFVNIPVSFNFLADQIDC